MLAYHEQGPRSIPSTGTHTHTPHIHTHTIPIHTYHIPHTYTHYTYHHIPHSTHTHTFPLQKSCSCTEELLRMSLCIISFLCFPDGYNMQAGWKLRYRYLWLTPLSFLSEHLATLFQVPEREAECLRFSTLCSPSPLLPGL